MCAFYEQVWCGQSVQGKVLCKCGWPDCQAPALFPSLGDRKNLGTHFRDENRAVILQSAVLFMFSDVL